MPKAFLRFSPRNRSPPCEAYSGSDAVRHQDRLRGALVVERQLFAAVPVGVVVAGLAAVPFPLVVEVPDDLVAGLRIALAVDLVHREGLAGRVVGEARLGADLRLARVLLGRGLVDVRGGVVAEEGADLELHAFVEEEVAIRPELRRQERLQGFDLVDGDDVAFLEGRRRGAGVLLSDRREREGEGQGEAEAGREAGAQAHGGSLMKRFRSRVGPRFGRRGLRRRATPGTVFIV